MLDEFEDVAGRAMASGFLVSGVTLHPQFGTDLYLLTAAHVIAREMTQQSFALTVDQAKFRLTSYEAQQPISLADIAWFSPVDELDLSVIRLKQQPIGVSGLAVANKLPSSPSLPSGLEKLLPQGHDNLVTIIGHPLGVQLTFSLGGVLLEHDDTQLQYFADTSPGSGGSPVLNSTWKVIGVHRLRGNIQRLSGKGAWTTPAKLSPYLRFGRHFGHSSVRCPT